MYDVIIVGAGPTGSYLAGLLNKLNVLLIEKNPGRDKVCSGLISTNIDKFTDTGNTKKNEVRGAIIHSPAGTINLEKTKTTAYVFDRKKMDSYLMKNSGVDVIEKEVSDIRIENDKVSVLAGKLYEGKILVGCDGADSIVRKKLGFSVREMVNGIKIVTNKKGNSDLVEIWFDKKLSYDGFVWRIPCGNETEYGALGTSVKFEIIEKFFGIKGKKSAALIPLGPCKSYSNRVLLIGDAAGQVKPWSGGGVVYGLLSAKIASDVISNAIKSNDFSEKFLKTYEKRWKKKIGRNIKIGMFFRFLYRKPFFPFLFFGLMKLFRRFVNKKDMDML